MDQYILGWCPGWDHHVKKCDDELRTCARIVARHKENYCALLPDGQEINCYLSGRWRYDTVFSADLPAVGDWCILGEEFVDKSNQRAYPIVEILPRVSHLSRKAAGIATDEQVLAANVDYVAIVSALNKDFNLNRLRRYLLLVENGGAEPIVLLSKGDLADEAFILEAQRILESELNGVRSLVVSAIDGRGVDELKEIIAVGKTAVFVGTSGVGKSTLVNALLPSSVQKVSDVSKWNHRGRHTTSASSLFFIDGAGMIIDTPGLREVGLLMDVEVLDRIMPSVKELSDSCKYRDCSHTTEPQCAVLDAVAAGDLPENELLSYRNVEREIAYERRKLDNRLAVEERKRWKNITKNNRRRKKHME